MLLMIWLVVPTPRAVIESTVSLVPKRSKVLVTAPSDAEPRVRSVKVELGKAWATPVRSVLPPLTDVGPL